MRTARRLFPDKEQQQERYKDIRLMNVEWCLCKALPVALERLSSSSAINLAFGNCCSNDRVSFFPHIIHRRCSSSFSLAVIL